MKRFDLVVIGSGPGGYTAAIRAAQLGMRTAVVESGPLGGVCLNWGCIPTKSILAAAGLFEDIGNARSFGIDCKEPVADYGKVVTRSRRMAKRLSAGVKHLLKENSVTVLPGRARLESPGRVSIDGGGDGTEEISAGRVLVAAGSREKVLLGLEPDGKLVLTSREALEASQLPESMIVIGGGAVGLEFAYIYNAFGCRVVVIEMMDQILPGLDREIADGLEAELRRKKIKIRTGTRYEGISKRDDDLEIAFTGPDGVKGSASAFCALVAVGREANIDGLGLAALGVTMDRGFVSVDGDFRTSVEGLYAVGDVTGPPLLAHRASEEGVAAVEKMAGIDVPAVDPERIPKCIYTRPEVASVGISEEEALAAGVGARAVRVPFRALGKAVASGHDRGFLKLLVGEAGRILGCHIVGDGATEMIAEAALAMGTGATVADVAGTVHAHPTLAEAFAEAALAADGRPRNTLEQQTQE